VGVVLLQPLQQLEQELEIVEANIKNIGSGDWRGTIQNVSQIDYQLSGTGTTVSTNDQKSFAVSTASSSAAANPGRRS
jgi:hypothetical protein